MKYDDMPDALNTLLAQYKIKLPRDEPLQSRPWNATQTTPSFYPVGSNETGGHPAVLSYLLKQVERDFFVGTKDLDDITVAMLNEYFALDFERYGYDMRHVNMTTESYWNRMQLSSDEVMVNRKPRAQPMRVSAEGKVSLKRCL